MAYYQTLPEWMRNNHLIRQVVVGMEFHGSHVANQAEKEAVLNMCLQFILPLPKYMEEFLELFMKSHKQSWTIHDELRLLGDPEEEEEKEEEETDKKKKKKKQQASAQQKDSLTAKQDEIEARKKMPFQKPELLEHRFPESERNQKDDLVYI
mmetsp:Transcript_22726/g.19749  ORF Transcript_22726/g.19749 Transcript_22726/m.19749 type:complete len:152 (+) Transcript_22726:1685-2140(+)